MNDPVIIAIVAAAGVVIVLSVVARLWRGIRERAAEARRRAARREKREDVQEEPEEQVDVEGLADMIVATSSTSSIAGFEIARQLEAVFTDGHSTADEAVEHLKAAAAEKGANAVINLNSARPPLGKWAAHGDAVIVRHADGESAGRRGTDLPTLPPTKPGPT